MLGWRVVTDPVEIALAILSHVPTNRYYYTHWPVSGDYVQSDTTGLLYKWTGKTQ